MLRFAVLLPVSALFVGAALSPLRADAEPADARRGESAAPARTNPSEAGFEERLVLDSSRFAPPAPEPDTVTFTAHGEYQLRYRAMSDLRLEAPQSDPSRGTLGQNHYVYHWMRLNPRLQWKQTFAIIGQIDVPRGLVLGDTTSLVDKTRDSFSEARWYDVHPRYLYLEYNAPFGVLRVGQQGSYWGMGILANDGDHRSLFGDYRRGSLVDRVLFATSPMGRGAPLSIALAGDVVFEDNTSDLLDDHDPAIQAVLAVLWRTKRAEVGVYGVIRRQTREQESVDDQTRFTESLSAGVVDVAAKVNGQAPGSKAYVYASIEAAAIFGSSTFLRSAYDASLPPGSPREPELIRSFGAAATLGVVRDKGRGRDRFGSLVAEIEWGYATGDADPYDGVSTRFTFDPNHRVGLLLFDQVIAWKTARAATLAQDPRLVRRPSPGLSLLPTKGGVAGAAYLNPRAVVRPKKWLDLKAGVVVAEATSDLVDPYHAGVLGSYATYDGGDERSRDLGLELDLGVDARIDAGGSVTIDLGAEGGALFPGRAFDKPTNEGGASLGAMYLANVKVGVQF